MELILDNVRSGGNTGSVFRTSDAFSIKRIYLCGITATPPHREVLKTALGSTETVAWEYHASTVELIQTIKQNRDVQLIGLEQDQRSVPIQSFIPEVGKEILMVLGNEVEGISEEVKALCDAIIEIPQYGSKKSLNVTVAAGIAIWDIFNRLSGYLPLR